MKILIIPDIHGRTFWREASKKFIEDNENGKVIFLGDYLDPYESEGISQEEAISNFLSIIKFKELYNKNVILLVGNHDMHYLTEDFGHCSRYDMWRSPRIKKIFSANKDVLQMAYYLEDGGKKIIISHAGIQKNWVKEFFINVSDKINDSNVVEYMNAYFDEMKTNPDSRFASALDIMSSIRGGWLYNNGSMVWADCLEYMRSDTEIYGDYQIFGHTRVKIPFLFENFACLDCSRAFILEDGVIKEMDGTEVEMTKIEENDEKSNSDGC